MHFPIDIVLFAILVTTLATAAIGYLPYTTKASKSTGGVLKYGSISGLFAIILLTSLLGIGLAFGSGIMDPKIATMIPILAIIIFTGSVMFGISNAFVRSISSRRRHVQTSK